MEALKKYLPTLLVAMVAVAIYNLLKSKVPAVGNVLP